MAETRKFPMRPKYQLPVGQTNPRPFTQSDRTIGLREQVQARRAASKPQGNSPLTTALMGGQQSTPYLGGTPAPSGMAAGVPNDWTAGVASAFDSSRQAASYGVPGQAIPQFPVPGGMQFGLTNTGVGAMGGNSYMPGSQTNRPTAPSAQQSSPGMAVGNAMQSMIPRVPAAQPQVAGPTPGDYFGQAGAGMLGRQAQAARDAELNAARQANIPVREDGGPASWEVYHALGMNELADSFNGSLRDAVEVSAGRNDMREDDIASGRAAARANAASQPTGQQVADALGNVPVDRPAWGGPMAHGSGQYRSPQGGHYAGAGGTILPTLGGGAAGSNDDLRAVNWGTGVERASNYQLAQSGNGKFSPEAIARSGLSPSDFDREGRPTSPTALAKIESGDSARLAMYRASQDAQAARRAERMGITPGSSTGPDGDVPNPLSMVMQNAAGKAQGRRDRIAARQAGPDPVAMMAQRDPQMARMMFEGRNRNDLLTRQIEGQRQLAELEGQNQLAMAGLDPGGLKAAQAAEANANAGAVTSQIGTLKQQQELEQQATIPAIQQSALGWQPGSPVPPGIASAYAQDPGSVERAIVMTGMPQAARDELMNALNGRERGSSGATDFLDNIASKFGILGALTAPKIADFIREGRNAPGLASPTMTVPESIPEGMFQPPVRRPRVEPRVPMPHQRSWSAGQMGGR